MSAPIIFCHYGNRACLKYVLLCAKRTNPSKEIILLGDRSNLRVARKSGIRHEFFDAYRGGQHLETFERVYRLIKGPNLQHVRGGRDWIKFVFERWFFVHNFVQAEVGGAFWHFDSDNMLLRPLAPEESR